MTNDIAQGDDGLYYQIGKKSVKGVELSIVGNVTDSWAISSGYTKLHTKVEAGTLVAQDQLDRADLHAGSGLHALEHLSSAVQSFGWRRRALLR